MTDYDIGDLARLRITTRDEAGDLSDPSTVAITITRPDGSTDDRDLAGATVTQESTGVFRTDVNLIGAPDGTWRYRWQTTGNPQVAESGRFYVRPLDTSDKMPRPTAAAVREASKLDFSTYGFSDGSAPIDPLDAVVDSAISYVEQMTGRFPLGDVPPELQALAFDAVRMRTEQVTLGDQADAIEGVFESLEGAGVQSFTVPGYSENRFRPEVLDTLKRINSWPMLADVLRLLMTEDTWDEWMFRVTGKHAPAMATTEVDWNDELLTTAVDPFDVGGWGWY